MHIQLAYTPAIPFPESQCGTATYLVHRSWATGRITRVTIIIVRSVLTDQKVHSKVCNHNASCDYYTARSGLIANY